MSAAEYRILVVHDPTDRHLTYGAKIYNLSGDYLVTKWGTDPIAVEREAREYVALLGTAGEPERELWVDGAGRDAVAPPSTLGGAS